MYLLIKVRATRFDFVVPLSEPFITPSHWIWTSKPNGDDPECATNEDRSPPALPLQIRSYLVGGELDESMYHGLRAYLVTAQVPTEDRSIGVGSAKCQVITTGPND